MASSTHLSVGIRDSVEPFDKLVLSLQLDPCIWILPAASPVKSVDPVDVPTKLKAAVVDSSVSPAADSSVSYVPEIRKVRWKHDREIF